MHPVGLMAFMIGLMVPLSSAIAAELTAEEIAQRALDSNLFSTNDASATIDIRVEKNGKTVRERRIRTKMKREDGLVRAFVEFDSPAEVAGTRFLSIEESAGKNSQFIYLPAFKKVKRIVGSQRDKSFMGTDFSFSDLEGRDVRDSVWKRLADEKIDGQDCYVIEGQPKDPSSEVYGKIVSWVHKEHLVPVAASMFAKDMTTLEKRLEVKKLQRKGTRVIATETWMTSAKNKSTTRLTLAAVDLDSKIPAELFRPEALER
ncbi:MAG: outer membrane lipoprotein-sorting protein [Deltaproteobacteria bacterium]|nr:outer membrane lipoprotein-sorting protein [Deltaproteobacteria bacterium]